MLFAIIFGRLYISNSNLDTNVLRKENETLAQNNTLLDDIISKIITISSKNYERYANYIESNNENINKENYINFINPKDQIKVVLDNISLKFIFWLVKTLWNSMI